mgnify:CR=1 FL=1
MREAHNSKFTTQNSQLTTHNSLGHSLSRHNVSARRWTAAQGDIQPRA